MARTIRVSELVYEAMQRDIKEFGDTPDKVLRRIYGIPENAPDEGDDTTGEPAPERGEGYLAYLLKAEVLSEGDELVFNRPRKKERHTATVTNDGWLRLPDGREFESPSGAADECAGSAQNGWTCWRTADGKSLDELRTEHELLD